MTPDAMLASYTLALEAKATTLQLLAQIAMNWDVLIRTYEGPGR